MSKPDRKRLLIIAGVLIWFGSVVGVYFFYHKPVSTGQVLALLVDIKNFLGGLLVTLAAAGLGRRILPASRLHPLERVAVQAAAGYGVGGVGVLCLGVAGGLVPWLLWLLTLLLIVLNLRQIKAWTGDFSAVVDLWREAGTIEHLAGGICGVLVIFQLGLVLSPPVKWDALVYHLQFPRQYLDAGRFVFVPENPFWGYPQLVEMLFTWSGGLLGLDSAPGTGWWAGVILLTGVMGCVASRQPEPGSTNFSSARGAWMAAAVLMAGFTFRALFTWAYVDLFVALMGLAVIISTFEWVETNDRTWMIWAGLFIGGAVSAKWTAAFIVFVPIAGIWVTMGGLKTRLQNLTLCGLAAAAVGSIWFIKNLVATGNPFYPYFFQTQWVDTYRIQLFHTPPEVIHWLQVALLPAALSVQGIDSASGFSADIGPFLLIFSIPAFIVFRRDRMIKILGISLSLGWICMGGGMLLYSYLMQTRLYFSLIPGVALAAGWGWNWVQAQQAAGIRLRRVAGVIVLFVMGLMVWQDAGYQIRSQPAVYLYGARTRQEYLENELGWYASVMQRLSDLPEGAKVMMIQEPRGYYAPLSVRADPWLDRFFVDLRVAGGVDGLETYWRTQGFTHILVNQMGVEYARVRPGQEQMDEWKQFDRFFASLGKPVDMGGSYLLYSLAR